MSISPVNQQTNPVVYQELFHNLLETSPMTNFLVDQMRGTVQYKVFPDLRENTVFHQDDIVATPHVDDFGKIPRSEFNLLKETFESLVYSVGFKYSEIERARIERSLDASVFAAQIQGIQRAIQTSLQTEFILSLNKLDSRLGPNRKLNFKDFNISQLPALAHRLRPLIMPGINYNVTKVPAIVLAVPLEFYNELRSSVQFVQSSVDTMASMYVRQPMSTIEDVENGRNLQAVNLETQLVTMAQGDLAIVPIDNSVAKDFSRGKNEERVIANVANYAADPTKPDSATIFAYRNAYFDKIIPGALPTFSAGVSNIKTDLRQFEPGTVDVFNALASYYITVCLSTFSCAQITIENIKEDSGTHLIVNT